MLSVPIYIYHEPTGNKWPTWKAASAHCPGLTLRGVGGKARSPGLKCHRLQEHDGAPGAGLAASCEDTGLAMSVMLGNLLQFYESSA